MIDERVTKVGISEVSALRTELSPRERVRESERDERVRDERVRDERVRDERVRDERVG